jgi:uncharacterized protein (DUF2384 family)
MAATAFDIHSPDSIVHDLAEASRRLRRSATVPDWILAFVADLGEDIGNADLDDAPNISPAAWSAVQSAALRALGAVREEDRREQRRKLRLLVEELRFRLARLAEDEPISGARPIKDVVRWLDQTLNVPQHAKAELFNVSDRTWQRWASADATSEPSSEQDREVRLVARLVNDLRFLLTANGVIDWLKTAQPDLRDHAPLDVIRSSDIDRLRDLLGIVARARSGAAT